MTRSKWSIVMHCSMPDTPKEEPKEKELLSLALQKGAMMLRQEKSAQEATQEAIDVFKSAGTRKGIALGCIAHDRLHAMHASVLGSPDIHHYNDGGIALCFFPDHHVGEPLLPDTGITAVQEALDGIIDEENILGHKGGIIMLDAHGRPAWAHSTVCFMVAYQSNNMNAPAIYMCTTEKKKRTRTTKKGYAGVVIDINNPFDAWGWSRKLNITPDQLRAVVKDVGTDADIVIKQARKLRLK